MQLVRCQPTGRAKGTQRLQISPVEKLLLPQLQDEQRPEAVAVVPAGSDVLLHEPRDCVRSEEAAFEAAAIEKHFFEKRLQLAAEPVIERDAEPHFASRADGG